MGTLRGALPDQAMRTRMVKHMESIPGFDKLTQTSWYPGKQFSGLIPPAKSTSDWLNPSRTPSLLPQH